MPIVIKDLSPPLAHRDRNNAPTLIVLHATAGSTAASSINHLRGIGLSYHYIIARDGRDTSKSENSDGTDPLVFHCVPVPKHAFHVASTIPTPSGLGINRASVGISLANIQRKTNPEAYPPKQTKAMHEIIDLVLQRAPSITHLTVHAVVQPWNRADPLSVNGKSVATRHGLTFWVPTPEQIEEHRPPRP